MTGRDPVKWLAKLIIFSITRKKCHIKYAFNHHEIYSRKHNTIIWATITRANIVRG